MKTKVLHIISNLDVAGAQAVVMNYLRKFSDDNKYEMHVAVIGVYNNSYYEQECKEKGYNVSYCEYKPWKGNRYIQGLINWIKLQYVIYKEIKRIRPNILHSHLTNLIPYILIPFLLSGVKKKFHTLHSDPYAVRKDYVPWARFAFNKAKIYPICVTKDQAEKAIKRYKIKDLTIIPNGLDIDRYRIDEQKSSIRKSINVPDDAYIVGCVSRFHEIKNFSFFIKVFAALKQRSPHAIAVLVGDGPEKENIIKWASEQGVIEDIKFLGIRQDVERMYKAFDVFLLTSLSESSSIVSVEAQLSGTRCVLSDAIPSNIVITNMVNRISLNAPLENWVDALLNKLQKEDEINPVKDFLLSNSISLLKKLYASH